MNKFNVGDKLLSAHKFSNIEKGEILTVIDIGFMGLLKFQGKPEWYNDEYFYIYTNQQFHEAQPQGPKFNASGSKYLRAIPTTPDGKIDVYAVLIAFNVTSPARQHAIKKLLCAGIRGKNNELNDVKEAKDAIERDIQLLNN